MIKKFGLAELVRYKESVGFKNGDVRAINGILAIINVPNRVVEEATEAIAKAREEIMSLLADKSDVKQADREDEAATENLVAGIKADRKDRKTTNKESIANLGSLVAVEETNIAKLEGILKKFS